MPYSLEEWMLVHVLQVKAIQFSSAEIERHATLQRLAAARFVIASCQLGAVTRAKLLGIGVSALHATQALRNTY